METELSELTVFPLTSARDGAEKEFYVARLGGSRIVALLHLNTLRNEKAESLNLRAGRIRNDENII
jgi:hypothetical protein